MKIIVLVLIIQGVNSRSITVTPNTTSIDILEGGNFIVEYKIDQGLSNNWSVKMHFEKSPYIFFIHRSGQLHISPYGCLNCNVIYNNLTTTFTLHLYNVTKNNSGTYTFALTHRNNFKRTIHQIRVKVREIPHLTTSDVSSLEFANLTLNCSINTDWFNKMWWTTLNGSTINSCNRSNGHDFQTCLAVLSNVTKQNQGFYICHAENPPHYSISKTISLDIVYGPQYSPQLLITTGLESYLSTSNITVTEGDVINISCIADCKPNCNYTWNNNNGNGSYLTVKAGRKTEYITCTTVNQYGKDNASVKVNALYSTEITNITTLNGKQRVNETDGENITMKCSAIKKPKPRISWLKNGDRIELYKSNHMSTYEHNWISEDSRTGYLFIQSLGCNTTGNYTCISYNGIGNNSKTMSVFVNCKPKILKPSENFKNKIAADTDFEIWYEGFPVPKFKWTFQAEGGNKDEDITKSINYIHRRDGLFRFKSVLLLKGMHINRPGRYKIDVWNFLGHASREIFILDSEVVRVNVYIAVLLPVLCFVLPVYIVAMCKIHARKRRNAKVNGDEERRHRRIDLNGAAISNVYANSVREIELAAVNPYEELSINGEMSMYNNVHQRRDSRNPQDLARLNADGQNSNESSVSDTDIDSDGYLIIREQCSQPACEGSEKKPIEGTEYEQNATSDGLILMEAPNTERNKEQ